MESSIHVYRDTWVFELTDHLVWITQLFFLFSQVELIWKLTTIFIVYSRECRRLINEEIKPASKNPDGAHFM